MYVAVGGLFIQNRVVLHFKKTNGKNSISHTIHNLMHQVQGDPNQNFPFPRPITLKVSTSDPKLVKPKLV